MGSPESRHRRGAHRAGRITSALMPSVLAVLAVAALVTAIAVWRGEEPSRPPAGATSSSTPPTRAALRQPTPSPTTSAATTPAPSSSSPSGRERRSPRPVRLRDTEVVVLNQTTRGGLASSVASTLRGRGWTVPFVGNFRGVVPATTVYYPTGKEAAALAAAKSLPTAPRTRPRFGNLSTARLTVVVTSSYPG